MRKNRRHTVYIMAIISAVFLWLSFPPWPMPWLAWFALVPLLIESIRQPHAAQRNVSSIAFGGPLLAGFVWGGATFYPLLLTVEGTWPQRIGGLVALGLFLALLLTAFMYFVRLLAVRLTVPSWMLPLAVPSLWVAFEFAMRHTIAGFAPYFGVTQWQNGLMLRLVPFTGVHGVSWLLVAVNTIIAIALQRVLHYGQATAPFAAQKNYAWRAVIVFVGVLTVGSAVLYSFPLEQQASRSYSELTFLQVQPNISAETYAQADREQSDYHHIVRQVVTQTEQALETIQYDAPERVTLDGETTDEPLIVIWPETVFHTDAWVDETIRSMLEQFVVRRRVRLIVGLPRWSSTLDVSATLNFQYNSVFALDEEGNLLDVYDKMFVIPIAEEQFTPGDGPKVIPFGNHRVGVGICSDAVAPDHARATVLAGANSLHYVSSLGQISRLASLQTAFIVLRAAEHNVYATQTATTGPTIVVEPDGTLHTTTDEYETATLHTHIPAGRHVPTLYTMYGDWFVALTGLLLIITAFTKRRVTRFASSAPY